MAIPNLAGEFRLLCLLLFVAQRTRALHKNEFGWSDTAAQVPPLPQGEIDELLDTHNDGRSEVEPPAANMNKVVWSHDLYVAAKDRVETCDYIVDIPKETGHYGKVVQFTGISRRSSFDLVEAVDMWLYLGKDSYNYEDNSCSRDNIYCKMYKLFTWGPMEMIGCAHTLCSELNDTYSDRILENTYYWKCNYFPVGDLTDTNPYTEGTPCLDCPDDSGWCNNEYDMCDPECSSSDPDCDCLYSDTCEGVYDYDSEACTCTCNHEDCMDDQFVCILKCGNPAWAVVDNDNGICFCDCPVGYETNDDHDICTDIDECSVDPDICEQYCDNTEGSYTCRCAPGFVLHNDGSRCIPFWEIGRHDFGLIRPETTTEAIETTTEVTTTELITETTTEVEMTTEEPETTTECQVYMCGPNGDYDSKLCACVCDDGYFFNKTTETCEDIDECASEAVGCDECENLPGDYQCTSCKPGFFLNKKKRCEKDVCNLGADMYCNDNGFLDEDACECVCYSGYKGRVCADTCSITEKSCWPSYSPRPPTDPSECVVYCPECECEGYQECSNNGTLARAAGFEFIKNGICRCYCPFPWSGAQCDECNLSCGSGGNLNSSDCSCSCSQGYYGVECEKPCAQKSRLCTTKTQDLCGDVPIIDAHCPVMCGLCVE